MDVQDLRTFLAVADSGSFSKAAATLLFHFLVVISQVGTQLEVKKVIFCDPG